MERSRILRTVTSNRLRGFMCPTWPNGRMITAILQCSLLLIADGYIPFWTSRKVPFASMLRSHFAQQSCSVRLLCSECIGFQYKKMPECREALWDPQLLLSNTKPMPLTGRNTMDHQDNPRRCYSTVCVAGLTGIRVEIFIALLALPMWFVLNCHYPSNRNPV